MSDWFADVAGGNYTTAMMWTVGALVLLLVMLLIVRFMRGLTPGTFVTGNRNRRPRLAVIEARAVDSQRRLLLVRRDDVEHLVLIGGPGDIVVEQGITQAAARTAAVPAETARTQPQKPVQQSARAPTGAPGTPPAPQPKPSEPSAPQSKPPEPPAAQPKTPQPIAPARQPAAPPPAESARPAPQLDTPPLPRSAPPSQGTAPPEPARQQMRNPQHDSVENDGLHAGALAPARGEAAKRDGRRPDDTSLEDEMSRLLEELSDERK